MMKVTLRAYNQEIESLINQGHTEEAVDHCLQILKSFPKHLETYRLMGKAYLEGHHYTEAADIFMRVLLAVPNDFVSHLGMSIINDEKQELSGAIWHMERAFEINSTNSGIQGELRRLYGRRDGVEPARIHLTRGALAHIYAKAGEFQQAISEAKAVLTEDNTRNDMKTLLARAYFGAGMKNEAVETCSELLKIYPYNKDANCILIDILSDTNMAQGVEQYKRRVQSLDPYAVAAKGSLFDTSAVPDNAVELDRLDWEPGQKLQKDINPPTTPSAKRLNADIPAWMQASGWEASTDGAETGQAKPENPAMAETPSGPLSEAEIPDWLKVMAPTSESDNQTEQPASPGNLVMEGENADFEWLANLGTTNPPNEKKAEAAPVAEGPVSEKPITDQTPTVEAGLDWMNGQIGGEVGQPAPVPATNDLPDWLKDLNDESASDKSTPVNPFDTIPDWLKNMAAEESNETFPAAQHPITATPTGQAPVQTTAEMSSEVQLPATGQTPPEEQPVFEIPTEQTPAVMQTEPVSKSAAEQTPTPTAVEPATEASLPTATTPGPGTSEQDEALAWLESLAANQGAKPEELLTRPEERSGIMPAWLKEKPAEQPQLVEQPVLEIPTGQALPTQQPAEETPAEPAPTVQQPVSEVPPEQPPAMAAPELAAETPVEQPPASTIVEKAFEASIPPASTVPGASIFEQDEALAWLESLAANQGAKPEELITKPEDRSATMPTWLNEQPTSEAPLEQTPLVQQPAVETPAELAPIVPQPASEIAEEQTPALTAPEPAAEVPAEQLPASASEEPAIEAQLPVATIASDIDAAKQDALAWLASLAEDQEIHPEEPLTSPEERSATMPAWLNEQPTTEPSIEETSAAQQPVAEIPEEQTPTMAAPEPAAETLLPSASTVPTTNAFEQDAALAWLESLAANQGAKPEELITGPEERSATMPAWLNEQSANEQTPESQQPVAEIPAEQTPTMAAPQPTAGPLLPPASDIPTTNAFEQDAALAWLESLAANQGAKPEELITRPEERSATMPAWLNEQSTNEQTTESQQPVAEIPAEQTPTMAASEPATEAPLPLSTTADVTSFSEQDDSLAWLASLNQTNETDDKDFQITENNKEELPSWLTEQNLSDSTPVAEQNPASEQGEEQSWTGSQEYGTPVYQFDAGTPPQEEDLSWLNSIKSTDDANLGFPTTSPTEKNEGLPAWLSEQVPAENTPLEGSTAPASTPINDITIPQIPASMADTQPTRISRVNAAIPVPASVPPPEYPPLIGDMPEPDLSELGRATAGYADEVTTASEPASLNELGRASAGFADEIPVTEEPQTPIQPTVESLPEVPPQTEKIPATDATPTPEIGAVEKLAAAALPAVAVTAANDFDWLGDLGKPQEIAIPQAEERVETPPLNFPKMITELPDAPDISLDWVTGKNRPGLTETEDASVAESSKVAAQEVPNLVPSSTEPIEENPAQTNQLISMASEQETPPTPSLADVSASLPKENEKVQSFPLPWESGPIDNAETELATGSSTVGEVPDWLTNLQAEDSKVTGMQPWDTVPAESTIKAEPSISNLPEESKSIPVGTDQVENAGVISAIENAPPGVPEPSSMETSSTESQITEPPVSLVGPPSNAISSKEEDVAAWLAGLLPETTKSQEPFTQEEFFNGIESTPAVSTGAMEEAAGHATGKADEIVDWLRGLDETGPQTVTPTSSELLPNPTETITPPSSTAAEESEIQSVPNEQDETAAWLDRLDEKAPVSTQTFPWEPASVIAESGAAEEQSKQATPAEKLPWEQETSPEPISSEPEDKSDISEWLKHLEEADKTQASSEETPSWLNTIAAPSDSLSGDIEELPDWLKEPTIDEQFPTSQPIAPSLDFQTQLPEQNVEVESLPVELTAQAQSLPIASTAETQPQLPEQAVPAESLPEEQAAQPESLPVTSAAQDQPQPAEQAASVPLQPVPVQITEPAIKTAEISAVPPIAGQEISKETQAIQKARDLLSQNNLNGSMSEYSRLIKKGKQLQDVISDLQHAVYKHPVDVVVWQTLGDAFFRSNRLQEALDAYNKAEGLLR